MKYKKIYGFVGLLIMLVLVFGCVFFISERKSIKSPQNSNQIKTISLASIKTEKLTITDKNPEIQNILNKAQDIFTQEKLVDGGIYKDSNYLQWKNSDGWNITHASSTEISAYFLCKIPGESPFENVIPVVYPALEKVFTENGFTKNTLNTIATYDRENAFSMGYSYDKAYEKGNIQCLVGGNPTCFGLPGGYGEKSGTPITIKCSDSLKQDQARQLPWLKIFNIKNSAILDVHTFGDFVFLQLDYYHLVALKQKDGIYKILYQGQDNIPCEIEDQYAFPKELRALQGAEYCGK